MSPGCVADGSKRTLDKLRALAPPNVDVVPGTCSSLCGNGPIVDVVDAGSGNSHSGSNNNYKRHRKVSGNKIFDLLLSHGDVSSEIVEGYGPGFRR